MSGACCPGADALFVASTIHRLEPCPTKDAPSEGRRQLMAKRKPAMATMTPTASAPAAATAIQNTVLARS